MPSDLLLIQNLSVVSNGKYRLKSINLHLKSGDFLGIIGANGAGKSTLLKAILHLIPFQADAFYLAGQQKWSPLQRARLLSYVPQSLTGLTGFTVYEYCAMARFGYQNIRHILSSADHQAIAFALDACDLSQHQKKRIDQLSGGESQRLLIASALAQQAKIMCLDEPTSALDPQHSMAILRLLRKLHQEHQQTIMMVSHDLNQIDYCCDQLLALKSGYCCVIGETHHTLTPENLFHIYDHPFLELHSSQGRFFSPQH